MFLWIETDIRGAAGALYEWKTVEARSMGERSGHRVVRTEYTSRHMGFDLVNEVLSTELEKARNPSARSLSSALNFPPSSLGVCYFTSLSPDLPVPHLVIISAYVFLLYLMKLRHLLRGRLSHRLTSCGGLPVGIALWEINRQLQEQPSASDTVPLSAPGALQPLSEQPDASD